jgi:hypothetical protein
MINRLELAWANWRALSKAEKAQFLILFSEAHARQRLAARGSGGRRGGPVLSLTELTATDADLEAAMARHSLG